jgi:outer membrane protein TolC
VHELRSIFAAIAIAFILNGCGLSPNPLTDTDITALSSDSLERMTANQEPIDRPVDLYEAMARALKYNLDHRVEEMGAAVRERELNLAHFGLLPSVVANSGYSGRSNDNASNSVDVVTGVQSLSDSTSTQRRTSTSDVTFSWNILDFGLSYVRARQAGDKYLIAEELRRRVVNRIVEDVRTAYWRALSADRLIQRLGRLEARIRKAQTNARSAGADRQTSPITAVTYERELVEIKRSIQELQRDLSVARTQLAALMNLKPGTAFALAGGNSSTRLTLAMPVSEMISTALQNRSELREVWYQRRINDQELNAALLQLLPGLTPYVGTNYDSNDYLYNNNWVNWGAKASWNVMRVFQYPAQKEVIEAQDRQLDARGLAVTMAVVTQVHVSRIRFMQFAKELKTANEFLEVQRRLVGLMRNEASADRISEQTLIREEMNTLVAEAKRDIAHAAMQNAFAAVYTSMGLDPYVTGTNEAADIKSLASNLRGIWVERGDRSAAARM